MGARAGWEEGGFYSRSRFEKACHQKISTLFFFKISYFYFSRAPRSRALKFFFKIFLKNSSKIPPDGAAAAAASSSSQQQREIIKVYIHTQIFCQTRCLTLQLSWLERGPNNLEIVGSSPHGSLLFLNSKIYAVRVHTMVLEYYSVYTAVVHHGTYLGRCTRPYYSCSCSNLLMSKLVAVQIYSCTKFRSSMPDFTIGKGQGVTISHSKNLVMGLM